MSELSILGTGIFLPGEAVTNTVLANLLNINQDWIDYFIGTKTRHFSLNLHTGEKTNDLAQMCYEAALNAIAAANIEPKDINAIVLATATPDFLMPTTVNMVAEKLAINNIPTFQIQSGCTGAIQALDFACLLAMTKQLNNVLVIGGDICNKFLNIQQDFAKLSRKELINYVLFGDGAGAIILSSQCKKQSLKIQHVVNRLTGLHKDPGQVIHWFANEKELTNYKQPIVLEDYKSIEHAVPIMSKEVFNEILQIVSWKKEDIKFLMPPQLNKHMTDKIVQDMDPEIKFKKVINCVEYTGNNGNALPFFQINKLFQEMSPNDKAILVAIESSKWIKAGVAFYA